MWYIIAGIYVVLMSIAGRAHGAATHDEVTGEPTGWPSWGKLASSIAFSLSFATVNYLTFHLWWLALIGAALTWVMFNTGHGRFFAMQGANLNDPNPEWIEKNIASWAYKGSITKPAYSWFCMGVKGLGVGLAAAPLGILLAFFWPLSYHLSWKIANGTEVAEWLRGIFSALLIVAALFLLANYHGLFILEELT